MKVNIEYDLSLKNDEVYIKLSPDCVNKERIVRLLNDDSNVVTAKINEKIYFLDLDEIESFYSFEQSVIAFSQNKEFKIKDKLYEVEMKFESMNFMRISKSTIINIKKIDYIAPTFNRTLMFKMISGETLYSSRSYNTKIKERIGV